MDLTSYDNIPFVATGSTVNTILCPSIYMNPVKIEKKLKVEDYKSMKKLLDTNIYDNTIKQMERDKKKNIENIFNKKKTK